VDGLHVERVAEDELDSLPLAEISEPVPGEDALGADDEAVAEGSDRLEQGLGGGDEVVVEDDLAVVREYAQVHPSRVEIDAAVVVATRRGEESHGGLLGWE